jgi:hypothetical protein
MALFAISHLHLLHPKEHCFGVFTLFQGCLLMSIHRPGELVRPADGIKLQERLFVVNKKDCIF